MIADTVSYCLCPSHCLTRTTNDSLFTRIFAKRAYVCALSAGLAHLFASIFVDGTPTYTLLYIINTDGANSYSRRLLLVLGLVFTRIICGSLVIAESNALI